MNNREFSRLRRHLGKTQKEMARLVGTSDKAVQSFEQGWRNVPVHIERQLLFLLSFKNDRNDRRACWIRKECPAERRKNCPAWEFKCGKHCWFINGTICKGEPQKSWKDKIKQCMRCEVMSWAGAFFDGA